MKTLLRVIAILFAVVTLTVAAAALILPRVIDPNVYRERIAELVEKRTGRELVIAGEIGWSVFPWLGVELGEVRLANAPGFGDEPFAQVSAMQVRVKLLPLLRKEVEMSTVLLDGLRVRLAKAKDGRTNWEDLFPADRSGAPSARSPKSTAAGPAAVAVGGVRVRDAQLVWDDRQSGTQYTLEKINLQTEAIRGDRPVAVDLNLTARRPAPPLEATVRLSGQVVPTQGFQRIEVRDLRLESSARGQGLPRDGLDAVLTTQLGYAADQNTLAIDDLVVKIFDMTLRGQARGNGIGGTAQRIEGSLRIEPFAPGDLLRRLELAPVKSSDPKVMRHAEGDFEFALTADAAQLRKLQLRLDDTRITGSAGLENFARPVRRFQLAVDTLDLDRYLAPRTPEAAVAAQEDGKTSGDAGTSGSDAGPGGKPEPLFRAKPLRQLRVNGSVRIGSLKAYQIRSKDVEINVAAGDGLLRIAPARAALYQGRYDGDITLDVRGKQPKIAMNERLSGVQIGPLLEDIQGKAAVTGKADIALKLTALGNQARTIRRTLNGDARFALADGTVKGMDLLGEIRKAYALLRGKAPAQVSESTEFSSLTGTATIVNGVMTNRDLQGRSPVMQVQGEGTANLVTDALDYRVTATLVDVLEGKGELTGRPIPVRITGSLAKPKVGVDLQQVLKQEVRKQVEKKIQEKLQDNLEGGLKGLLGK